MDETILLERLSLACAWITDVAQVKEEVPRGNYRMRPVHTYWKGSIPEYDAAEKRWEFFCPVWHTGQALKALCLAYPVTKNEKVLAAARLAADFIAANQITGEDDPDRGLVFAYEDDPDQVNTSAVLECLDGWFHFAALTGEEEWNRRAIAAAGWVMSKSYLWGEGLFQDCYDPKERKIIPRRYRKEYAGRPTIDDGIFHKAHVLTGDARFRTVFYETAERLLKDEDPPGNWIFYGPCNKTLGSMHPRHAYWWGYPMLYAYQETGERRFLDCLIRSGDWYARAQRKDGGLFRTTFADFNTYSFGHAASGMACAIIMWQDIERVTGEPRYRDQIALGLKFLLGMQFTAPQDANLRGAILEKVREPDGTDRLPYYVRDLATIFFIQALAKYLGVQS